MTLKIYSKSNYGVKHYYPACENAKELNYMTKGKTIPEYSLLGIQKMGYEVEEVTEPNMAEWKTISNSMKKPTAQDWNNRMAEIADRYIHQE